MAGPAVSTDIFESLFFLYLSIALVVGGLVIGWLFYNMWAFRARPGMARPRDAPVAGVLPAERGRPIWSWGIAIAIAAIMFGLAFSTINAVNAIEIPPEDREWNHYNVTGFQFGWRYHYVGEGGIPFQKVGTWAVPVDSVVVMNITSQDVWHNFAISDFRIRVDAIPGEVNRLWFEATQTGEFGNVCVQLCGSSHAVMKSTMRVVTQDEYRAYVAQESTAAYNKLADSIHRDARAGTLVNVTLADGAFTSSADRIVPGKPVFFNVTNPGASPVTLTATDGAASSTVTVAPGAYGRLWLMAPASGAATLSANGGPTATFQVVSS